MKEKLSSLINYCSSDGRVCPLPMKWNELWEMLPGRKRVGDAWEPPLPLILAAWSESSASDMII
jgi:hypothetical protein